MTRLFHRCIRILFFVGVFLSAAEIDVVIPCHPKDFSILPLCVRGIRENGKDIRRIIVVTKDVRNKEVIKMARKYGAELFNESLYPFNLIQVGEEVGCKSNRGWFFQQLLKIYAFQVIPGLADHLLLLDADTVFLNKTGFIDESGKTLFCPSRQHHDPYFIHAQKLVPGFKENCYGLSGICNFMIIRRDVIKELLSDVELYHQKPFWKAFLHEVEPAWRHWVGASEFEIYFNYFLDHHPDEYAIQELKWDETLKNIQSLNQYQRDGYNFVTCHHWQRVGK